MTKVCTVPQGLLTTHISFNSNFRRIFIWNLLTHEHQRDIRIELGFSWWVKIRIVVFVVLKVVRNVSEECAVSMNLKWLNAKTDSLPKVSGNICVFIKVSSTFKMMGQNSNFTMMIAWEDFSAYCSHIYLKGMYFSKTISCYRATQTTGWILEVIRKKMAYDLWKISPDNLNFEFHIKYHCTSTIVHHSGRMYSNTVQTLFECVLCDF